MNSPTIRRPIRLPSSAGRLSASGSVGRSESNVIPIIRQNDIVATDLGGQRRYGLSVCAHAVEVVLGVDRYEILVLAHLPLAVQPLEGEVPVRGTPRIENGIPSNRRQVRRYAAMQGVITLDQSGHCRHAHNGLRHFDALN